MSEFTTDHDLQAYEDMSCGYECHMTDEYGFVPEAGCPIHDKKYMNNEKEKDHLVMCPKCECPVLIDGENTCCVTCGLEIKDFNKYTK